jgi:hypothetical protein
VLGRAGEAGRNHRLALAKQKRFNFQATEGLRTPGHLQSTKKTFPSIVKLGATIQELEEQDRGIVYDYRLDEIVEDEENSGGNEGSVVRKVDGKGEEM